MKWLAFCCFLTLSLESAEVSAFLWNAYSPGSCDQLPEYKNIITTLGHQHCISDTQIWQLLSPLQKRSHTCLQQLISFIAGYIEAHHMDGKECHCSHNFAKEHSNYIGYGRDHIWACLKYNPNCEYLYNYFYLRSGETHARSNCQSNVHVWTHLRDIKNFLNVDEQTEIITHLSRTFSNGHENVCTCTKGNHQVHHTTGSLKLTTELHFLTKSTTKANPTSTVTVPHTTKTTTPQNTHASATSSILPSSTAKTSTSVIALINKSTSNPAQTTDTVSSTNSPLNVTTNCEKYQSLSNIATAELASHPLAYLCQSGNRTSNEAFVLTNCNVGSPEYWIEGPNVMANCGSIPTYTPIATFKTEYAGVHQHEGLSGIFLGCIPGGFKLAYQNCDTSATIKHVEIGSGSGIDNPNNYFVIL